MESLGSINRIFPWFFAIYKPDKNYLLPKVKIIMLTYAYAPPNEPGAKYWLLICNITQLCDLLSHKVISVPIGKGRIIDIEYDLFSDAVTTRHSAT